MDSVTIRFSSQKDLKRRSPNYRPTRKTRSVIAPKRWPNWFGISTLRAGQHESDWNANPRWCSWFETPAAEGGDGGELSKIGLPMLCPIMASTANPLLGSTLITATLLPVIWRQIGRASCRERV